MSDKEQEQTEKRLPSRATRGLRMNKLIGEELEKSNLFWSQAATIFEEDGEDDEYESDAAADEDVVDSDFDAPEDQGNPQEPGGASLVDPEEEAARKRKKASSYQDVAKKVKRVKKVVVDADEDDSGAGVGKAEVAPSGGKGQKAKGRVSTPRTPSAPGDVEDRPSVRASTKQKSQRAKLDREQREELQEEERRGGYRRRRKRRVRELTRAELLAEAAVTEQINTASLAQLTALEEELKKKRAPPPPKQMLGPRIRYVSRLVDGKSEYLLGFADFDPLPTLFRGQAPPPYPAKAVCAVTGKPARYRDPQTGLPYADASAFAALRKRSSAGSAAVPMSV